jgi:1,4-dihydroxy-2-naphthoate octaprenyltransferase
MHDVFFFGEKNAASPPGSGSPSDWVQAARLRTLPLSCSGVILGGGLAAAEGMFSPVIFALSVLTAVLLQILGNFANDYGDALRGTDGAERKGPKRAVASGSISSRAMFRAVVLLSLLSLLSGAVLLLVSFGPDMRSWGVFAVMGAGAVAAAVFYTMGKRPYGYRGLGDFFCFIFFGLVAVAGSYALYGAPLLRLPGLPACATGFFITAVLNINNIRDMENDHANGKETVALRLGAHNARVYHLILVASGLACWTLWFAATGDWRKLALLAAAFPVARSAWIVYGSLRADVLDAQLRITSLGTGFFNVLLAALLPRLA